MPQHQLCRRDERRELRVRLLPRRRRRSERDGGDYDSVAGGRDSSLRAELALRLAHHVDDGPRRAHVHGARDRERLRLRQDLRGEHRADGLFAHGSGGGAEAALRGDGRGAAPEARLRGPGLRDVRVGRPWEYGRRQCWKAALRSSTGSPRRPRIARGAWTAPVANCALDHCTGESELVVPAGEARRTASSRRAPARWEELGGRDGLPRDDDPCSWKFTLPDAASLRGLSLRAKKASTWNNNDETTWARLWDVEASGALTSTTDAVHIYASDDTLVGTLKGDKDPAVWEFDLENAPGDTYTAVFASDLNNPVPKKGFDLVYAGRYGDAIAGASGGFCRCDFGGTCDWPCDAGLVCKGTCRPPAKKKEPEDMTALIAVICVFGVFIVIGAAYMFYMHLEHQKQIDAMAQELKDAVVGFKVCVRDYVPAGHSTQQAAVDVSSPGTWYWQEEAHRMGQHPPTSRSSRTGSRSSLKFKIS